MPFIENFKLSDFASLFPSLEDDYIWSGSPLAISSQEVVPIVIGKNKFIFFFIDPNSDETGDTYRLLSDGYKIHRQSRIVKFVSMQSIIKEDQDRAENQALASNAVDHFQKGKWKLTDGSLIFQLLEVIPEVIMSHANAYQCEEYYYIPANPQLQRVYERTYKRYVQASEIFCKIVSPNDSVLGFRKLKASNDQEFDQSTASPCERNGLSAIATDNDEDQLDLRKYFTGEVSD